MKTMYGLIDIITYDGQKLKECESKHKGAIVVLASKLETLEDSILEHNGATINVSANRIFIDGLPSSLKRKVLDLIYKK